MQVVNDQCTNSKHRTYHASCLSGVAKIYRYIGLVFNFCNHYKLSISV